MLKLRRSRLMKFIAGVMIIILAAAVVGNIVGTFIIMDENLYYANRQQIQQKVYSYLYDYTASDLMRYLNAAENMYSNNDNYKNYHSSELELYRSKYLPENSNIHFEIKDEYGNILLNNDNRHNGNTFSFSSVFTTDTMYYDGWYVQGGSMKEEYVTPAITEINESYAETTALSQYENEAWDEDFTSAEENAFSEVPTTLGTESETATGIKPGVPGTPVDIASMNTESISINNKYSGSETEMIYYYSGELDDQIFFYCQQEVRNLNYDITSITYFQDDFTYSENDIVRRYSANDISVPAKTFSTKFISDSKEITINYTYNGSFYINEFETRLSYLSLIVKNIDQEQLTFNYTQKGQILLTVLVDVPHSCYASDVYNLAEELVDIAIVYRDNIASFTVADMLLLITALIYLFWSAGYIPGKTEPVARGLHAIPFDLYLFVSAAAAIGCCFLIDSYDELWTLLGFIGLAFILLSLIYTIPVRLRAKKIKTNNLFYKIYSVIKSSSEVLDERTGSRLKIFIYLSAFLIISAIEVCFFAMIDNGLDTAAILTVVRLLETPVLAFLLVALVALHNGAKKISQGDVGYRIRHSFLSGPLKRHAEYLNSINNAVNNAVEERLKSESLKTELITNVSHDLKTPLTSIVNYVDLLKKTDIKDPKALEYISVIDRQSQRLKKLTVDIVEASKAATGNIEVNYENTVLNVILLQTNGEYIERLEEKSLTLVQDIPDSEITVSTDGRLLWRVIDNLMNNICKYSMPGTRVYLSLWEHAGRAFISFRNISKTKLNISPDELTERFVRGDTSRNTEGSGLGLSIANSLTEIMGGKLSIIIDGDLFKVTLSFPTVSETETE